MYLFNCSTSCNPTLGLILQVFESLQKPLTKQLQDCKIVSEESLFLSSLEQRQVMNKEARFALFKKPERNGTRAPYYSHISSCIGLHCNIR